VEVERLQRDYDVEVRFAPSFHASIPPEAPRKPQTRPDDPPTAMELRAQSLGIGFTRGRTFTPNSHLSLEAAEFAADHGEGLGFHRAMFKAFFEDMVDIGTVDNLVRVGGEAGLDEGELRRALETGQYREQVDDGIHTFVFDEKYGIVGAQDYTVFQSVMEKLGVKPKA
jgi:predicted DsbA family dithiol-disulfide isomerase